MGNNTFNIVNYFKLIILKGLYIIFGIISFLLFAFGVKKTTAKCIYELMGIDQEIALILFAIGIVSSLIILTKSSFVPSDLDIFLNTPIIRHFSHVLSL